jgi:predicted nucleic acid-binding protein
MTAMNTVDSSGWLEYFADTRRAKLFAAAIEDPDHLIVPVVTIYEVFKKFRRERSEGHALDAVSVMRSGTLIDLDVSLALEAGRFALPLADSLIYATTQRYHATLWTQDEDFDGLPGVRYFPRK